MVVVSSLRTGDVGADPPPSPTAASIASIVFLPAT
jgi:hypothetical protein